MKARCLVTSRPVGTTFPNVATSLIEPFLFHPQHPIVVSISDQEPAVVALHGVLHAGVNDGVAERPAVWHADDLTTSSCTATVVAVRWPDLTAPLPLLRGPSTDPRRPHSQEMETRRST